MEIKDLKNLIPINQASQGLRVGKQISGRSLVAPTVDVGAPDGDPLTIQLDRRAVGNSKSELSSRANELINVTNVASDTVSEIEKLLGSIGGIVDQAKSTELPEGRRNILEKEANELISEIRRRAATSSPNGVKPLAGDKIRLEVEERLGKLLEVVLPSDATEAFGLGQIRFSPKEAILDTIANVEKAKQKVKDLRGALDSTIDAVKSTVTQLDVAQQNTEASQTSLRDVEDALKLATTTRNGISANAKSALGALGNINPKFLDLLDR